MNRDTVRIFQYSSTLADEMNAFLEEKRACGYLYNAGAEILLAFDRFLRSEGVRGKDLPKVLVNRFVTIRSHEQPRTQKARLTIVRQFAVFLGRRGCRAYVPDRGLVPRAKSSFIPRILSRREVGAILRAADSLPKDSRSPYRHDVMPVLFRLLYGCGLRVGEAVNLRVSDVDLASGVLTVLQGKFRKDRLVPVSPSLARRLHVLAGKFGDRCPDEPFFPSSGGGVYHRRSVYGIFRRLLWQCGIGHGGKGRGPRLHDLRHSFAVHRVAQWYKEGADLEERLPVLATYLGHQDLDGTQRYLQLTADIFPDLVKRAEDHFGTVIPTLRSMNP